MDIYSKENPSKKYLELGELYKQLHSEGEKSLNLTPEETFQGISLAPQLTKIKNGISLTSSKTLLDYGCGKALAWLPSSFLEVNSLKITTKEFLELDEVYLYDPGYEPYSTEPTKKYDAVICTDVLEHIPELDIKWFINELFTYSNKYVFANIAVYPAKKIMPNGENAHCTIKPIDWWKSIFDEVSALHQGVEWEIWIDYFEGNLRKETGLSSMQKKSIINIGKLKSSIQKILKKTTSPKVLNSMSTLSISKGEIEGAIAYLQKAIRLNPIFTDSYLNLSSIYLNQKDYLEAQNMLRSYPKYLENDVMRNQISKNYIKIASEYFNSNDYPSAIIYFSASLEFAVTEDLVLAYKKMATCSSILGNTELAYKYIKDAYILNVNNVDTLKIYATIAHRRKNYEEALGLYQKILTIIPNDASIISAKGAIYLERNNFKKAEELFLQALALDPLNATNLLNMAGFHFSQGQYSDSISTLEKALKAYPNIWQFHYYLATGYLGKFDFIKGWDEFKYREENLDELGNLRINIDILPNDLSNRHILVYAEQGIGDELFYLRFFGMLKQRGAFITYRTRDKLYKVLSGNSYIDKLEGEKFVLSREGMYSVCSVTELPRLLNMNSIDLMPDPLPLNVNEDIVNILLEKFSTCKTPLIGITWRAGTNDTNNSYSKELPLSELIASLKELDVRIVILQRNPQEAEIKLLEAEFPGKVIDASAYNEDLEKMLALISVLDKYIAVSNTNIHLAASIQKKCHILVPFPAEWRWGNNDSCSSPWFKGFKLYRQKSLNANWNDELKILIEDIKNELSEDIRLNEHHLNINDSIRLIDELVESQRYLEAEVLCQKILNIDEYNLDALMRYLKVLNLTDQHEKLIGIIERIQRLNFS